MAANLLSQLQNGCELLGFDFSAQQYQQLIDYVGLMAKWNKVYNLTSIRDEQEMVSRHLLDSLAITNYIDADNLLDVGTGGGLPGIPLAIVKPHMQITLLDSNSKKTRFLQQVKAELNLDNVTVVHSRVEQANVPKFQVVTARAFATIKEIIDLAGRHCDDAGHLVLMKGIYPQQELDAAGDGFTLKDVITLDVPNCDGERHVVRLVKS
jgi:16S rRNA (guanine527-N7)-methyltransferase